MEETDFTGRNPLKNEEAGELAEIIADSEAEEAARILLLCYAFAYETSLSEREHMMRAVERHLLPYTPGVAEYQQDVMGRELRRFRGQD